MASRLSYDEALTIAQKGKYYPQPTNHAGLPVHPVFCDYCGRNGLGGSWKYQNTQQWDLCMQCYVAFQTQSNTTNTTYTANTANTANIANQAFLMPMTSALPSSLWAQKPLVCDSNQYQYQSAWDCDVPGSYSNRIITSKDGWTPN